MKCSLDFNKMKDFLEYNKDFLCITVLLNIYCKWNLIKWKILYDFIKLLMYKRLLNCYTDEIGCILLLSLIKLIKCCKIIKFKYFIWFYNISSCITVLLNKSVKTVKHLKFLDFFFWILINERFCPKL